MGGASTIATIISDSWDEDYDGDTPSEIGIEHYGQGDYLRFEFSDECILVGYPVKDFVQPGVEQYYEKDIETFIVHFATLTSVTRFDQIENALRRIFLNYGGGTVYSRVHLDTVKEIPHHFYFVGEAAVSAYLNLSHANTS